MPRKSRRNILDRHIARVIAGANSSRPLPNPTLSRKTNLISIKDASGHVLHSVPLDQLDDEIDTYTQLSDGTGEPQTVLNQLRESRILYGHKLENKKKARGNKHGGDNRKGGRQFF